MEETKRTYGVRRFHQALKNMGFDCSRGLVENIMSKNDIRPKRIHRYKKTTDSNHSQIVAPNKLNRKFSPLKPNEVWTSDITYLRTREGWLCLCVWIALYSRKVVGWSIANHMRA